MRIVFLGTGAYVLPIVAYLHTHHHLVFVVTTEVSLHSPVLDYCKQNNIPSLSVETLKDAKIQAEIRNKKASAGILANFRCIVPQEVLDIFPKGIINIHPSLLPKYRGTTPGQSAILNDDTITGVTLMLLDSGWDHGDILAQREISLNPDETGESFYLRSFGIGTSLLEENLDRYGEGTILPVAQDHTKATYTKTLKKEDGFVDSAKPIDKERLSRMIRAYHPWPGAWTICHLQNSKLDKKIVKFLPNTALFSSLRTSSQIGEAIPTGFNNIYLQVEGKKPLTIKDFLNGYPEAREWLKKFL